MRKSLFDKQMDEFDKTPDEDNVHLEQIKKEPETISIDMKLYNDLTEYLLGIRLAYWQRVEIQPNMLRDAKKLLSRLEKEKF